jgi:hypothetical protein
MVSSQIQQMAPTLISRGIDPSLVPKELVGETQVLLEEIEEMPIDAKAAAVQAAAAVARATLTSLLARTAAAASSTFLRVVTGFFEAMWTVGRTLISIPLIIVDKDGNPIGMSKRPPDMI